MSNVPDTVYHLTRALRETTAALGGLSESIYYDDDHRFGDFSEEYGKLLSKIEDGITGLEALSRRIDEQEGIQRVSVDPRLMAARSALRKVLVVGGDAAEIAQAGLDTSIRKA